MGMLIKIGIRILEAVFAFGLIGSAIVVIVAGVEDVAEIFQRDKEEPEPAE